MAADSVITPELELVTPQKMTMDDKIAELRRKQTKIKLGGGKQRKTSCRGTAQRAQAGRKARRSRQLPGNRRFRQASFHVLRDGR
jgi:hypothetical protein